MTREQRLRTAVDTSAERVKTARKERDEQAIFEALGECLMWAIALDDLLESHSKNGLYKGDYKNDRDTDHQRQGQLLKGLRYARNAIVHGDVVVDVAESVDVPNPSIVSNRRGPRIFVPPTRVQWTFRHALPPLSQGQSLEPHYRTHVAGLEVTVPIVNAANWLDRAIAML